jgi:minimal PKS acyl carrier protein
MAAMEFTIDDLKRILREAAGDAEGSEVPPDSDILDVSFVNLGYDSLALLETARRIGLERKVELADSVVIDATTPRELLASVNKEIGATTVA